MLYEFGSIYDVLLIPSLFELVNCSNNASESNVRLPPVCWLTERAIFCFCLSIRSFSRAKRNCSKSSSECFSFGLLATVQSTSSSVLRKEYNTSLINCFKEDIYSEKDMITFFAVRARCSFGLVNVDFRCCQMNHILFWS